MPNTTELKNEQNLNTGLANSRAQALKNYNEYVPRTPSLNMKRKPSIFRHLRKASNTITRDLTKQRDKEMQKVLKLT